MPKCVTKISVALGMCVPLNPKAEKHTHYVCIENECNSTLSALKSSNIIVHMEAKHAEIFKKRWAKAALPNINGEEMEIRRMELIQTLTETVTRNSRPFALLNDSGFRKLIRKELEVLTEAGYGIGFTNGDEKCPPVVLEHIRNLSTEIMNAIKLEIKGLHLSLMVDIGSRNGRDILGISTQYMRDGRITIRSLGMILLSDAHTALNVKNKILACLHTFDINPSQIVSITTDNASNMLAMIKSFNQELDGADKEGDNGDSVNNDSENDFPSDANYVYDIRIDEIERIVDEYHTVNLMTNTEIEAERRNAEAYEILEETSNYLNLLKDLQNEFILHTLNTSGIKCAAHTLQLAIKSALKSARIGILINVCRMSCKLVRKISYKNEMRKQNLKEIRPRLDVAVRWNSTYMMVT